MLDKNVIKNIETEGVKYPQEADGGRKKTLGLAPLAFAMRLSPKAPWKLETDVKVEDNGRVFLVYPLTNFAREWLEKDENIPRGSERVGDIVVVERSRILHLVARMIDSDLWVVWR